VGDCAVFGAGLECALIREWIRPVIAEEEPHLMLEGWVLSQLA
jgi:hypothetical protein